MSEGQPTQANNEASLRIWQQNLNNSLVAQELLLNSPIANHWDIILIQEPHINFLCNTRANHGWHILYPTQHYSHPQQHTRTITLVNANQDTNAWTQIGFPSSDVVILQTASETGNITILNIYNDCNNQDTLAAIDNYLAHNIATIRPADEDQMLWMGDFNRHHPAWEEIQNRHLYNYTTSQPLIDLIADYGMLQLLPIGIPTLQASSTGNWMRQDNVFGTEQLADNVISCTTAPELRGPRTDHLPIHLIIDTSIPTNPQEARKNWRDVDWTEFNETLSTALTPHPPYP